MKITVNWGGMDTVIEVLESLKVPYTMTVRGEVPDRSEVPGGSGIIPLHRLVYAGGVYLEYVDHMEGDDDNLYMVKTEEQLSPEEELYKFPLVGDSLYLGLD